MIRVAQVIPCMHASAGGTSTAFLATIAALRTQPGVAVHAFTARPPESDPAWAHVNAHAADFTLADDYRMGIRAGDVGRRVVAAAQARAFDIAHLHGLWSPDLRDAAIACRHANIPCFWEPHGMLVREAYQQKRLKKELFMALGLRSALQACAGLIFVTAEERDHSLIPSSITPERRHVVPLPVITPTLTIDRAFCDAARARFNVPPDVPCIVFMGRLHPVKRVELAIDALAALSRVAPRFAHARLLLVGGGDAPYEAELRARAAAAGVADRVLFAGWVQGDDKWRALAAGNILTLNSVHENFGFVAVEALCVGTFPVLTSNLAIAAELTEAAVGLSCDPTSQSMADTWARALEHNGADFAPVLSRGRAWVDAHLSTAAVGRTLVDLYTRVRAPKP